MKNRGLRIGPGAASLTLIVLVLCMSVMGELAFINAVGDYKLSQRGAMMTSHYYEADALCAEMLSTIDAILVEASKNADDDEAYINVVIASLPDDFEMDDRVITWAVDAQADRRLICSVALYPLGEGPNGARYAVVEHGLTDDMQWEEVFLDLM